MKSKRILWLYNHKTLIKSEVKILQEMGYEIYAPKYTQFDVSVAVDWSLDKQLSIPQKEIDILNDIDFYDKEIPEMAMNVMNQYFDIVIFGIFIEPLKSLVLKFKGTLLFHPFGLEDGVSYSDIINVRAGLWLMSEIEKLGNRFWFGQSYENLMEIECDFFKEKAIDLPIGLVDITINDVWTGINKKVLFICPRIRTNRYYENIYKNFKKDFKGIPHSIGGAQQLKVETDSSVLGYLEQKEYDELYLSHSVMFYHSRNVRHVHYHPFEAIKCGLPLIFMAGGLLDFLGGEALPGRCKTIKEARQKCMRIIKGDKKFADKVRNSQGVLLEKLSYQYCKEKWAESMLEIEKAVDYSLKNMAEERFKRIGVILPVSYTGGVLDYTINLLLMMQRAIVETGDKVELIFGHLRDDVYSGESFKKIKEQNIEIREFQWEDVPYARVEEIYKILGYLPPIARSEHYCLLNDGIQYFEDCDILLFTADRVPLSFISRRPHAVIIHDYIQRYYPEQMKDIFEKECLELVRRAIANFTTGELTRIDSIQYAGVQADKIHLLPRFFDYIEDNSEICKNEMKSEYFLWSTNMSEHKNHMVALEALNEYYECGGEIDCYITGVNTEQFDREKVQEDEVSQYAGKIRKFIIAHSMLDKHIKINGNLSKRAYQMLLKEAKFVLHPGYADNGNGSIVDAAMQGVPAISSDYPAMREINNYMKLNIRFFNYLEVSDLLKAIWDMDKNCSEYKANLPHKEKLKTYTTEDVDLCLRIYREIKEKLYI